MKNTICDFILLVSIVGVTIIYSYDTVNNNTELWSPICKIVPTEDIYQNFRSVSDILAGKDRDIIVQQMPFTLLLSGCQGKVLYISVLASYPQDDPYYAYFDGSQEVEYQVSLSGNAGTVSYGDLDGAGISEDLVSLDGSEYGQVIKPDSNHYILIVTTFLMRKNNLPATPGLYKASYSWRISYMPPG
ncbi:hypothetical protein ABVL59_004736 [Salmonella enterica]|nr:hypothetical protein [Salmonella enterica]ECA7253852.1 hypothetical protein [Salmonella enterica subsp. enterica serovar Oranienburg]ECU9209748.1 hypothetical protein [Salmonella enterica subsp. enterica serovar Gatuni]EDT0686887.1 hypothetical protein [Salmonella enterica subsp. enterica serovar Kokomlemle]EEE1373438.1 hypothetical protein [Salmonella enterica subsp. enterica serovar Durban]